MPWLLLLLFALICIQTQPGDVSGNPWPLPALGMTGVEAALLTWGVVLQFWLLATFLVLFYARRIHSDYWQSGQLLRRCLFWRRWHGHAFLTAYLVCLYGGWGWFVASVWPDAPGAEFVIFAPFLGGLILFWERFYAIEKLAFEQAHFHEPFIGKGHFLVQQVRSNLLVVILSAFLRLIANSAETLLVRWQSDYVVAIVGGIMVLGLIMVPWLLRVFLGLRPLEAGPLRTRLEKLAGRLRFRYANILVWDTRSTMANAMVSGFVPWVRYIILTDRLIEELTPEEIEAVFGHEIGHIKHHHLALYALFCVTSFLVFGAVSLLLGSLRPLEPTELLEEDWQNYLRTVNALLNVLSLGCVAIYFFFVFGYLSRRCERQADLYGCSTVTSATFISALEKVAKINGMPREPKGWFASWLHPTIGQRVDFLQRASADPLLERRFHRSLGILRWTLVLGLPCLVWMLFYILGKDDFWRVIKLF